MRRNKPTSNQQWLKCITLAYNRKSKEEVDQVFDLAKKVGSTTLKEPETLFWESYSGYF